MNNELVIGHTQYVVNPLPLSSFPCYLLDLLSHKKRFLLPNFPFSSSTFLVGLTNHTPTLESRFPLFSQDSPTPSIRMLWRLQKEEWRWMIFVEHTSDPQREEML